MSFFKKSNGFASPEKKSNQPFIRPSASHIAKMNKKKSTNSTSENGPLLNFFGEPAFIQPQAKLKTEQANDKYEKEANNVADRIVIKAEGLSVQKKASADANPELTKDERLEMRRITGDRIGLAYTDYIDAAKSVKKTIHDISKAQIDFMFFLADIALGFLMPGVGKGLAKWADKIPTTVSNAKFRAAYMLLDASTTTSLLTASTKVGSKLLKSNYSKLAGMGKTDAFIDKMKEDTRKGFDATNSNLPNLTDQELTSVYLAFDTDLTNATAYKNIIWKTVERFRKQILTIGDSSSTNSTIPQSTTTKNTGVFWLEYEPKKVVLVNITLTQKNILTRGGQQSTQIKINSLIDKDLGPLAERIGKAEQPDGVKKLTFERVKQMKTQGLIQNYPKSIPSGKHIKTTS